MKHGDRLPTGPWLAFLVFLAASAASAAEFHVSPSGSDANAGTRERPFATLQHAVEASRATPGPNKILIRAGTYFLSGPLVLEAQDSGLTIEGQGQGVVVSGGRRVTGWVPWKGHILKADLSKLGLADFGFSELYYRTKLQPWARVPNFDPSYLRTGGFLQNAGIVESGTKTKFRYRQGDLRPERWAHAEARMDRVPRLAELRNPVLSRKKRSTRRDASSRPIMASMCWESAARTISVVCWRSSMRRASGALTRNPRRSTFGRPKGIPTLGMRSSCRSPPRP